MSSSRGFPFHLPCPLLDRCGGAQGPSRPRCQRKNSAGRVELALPWEGNGLRSRPEVDAPGCAGSFTSTSGTCKELHSHDVGPVEDEENGTGASFLLCDGARKHSGSCRPGRGSWRPDGASSLLGSALHRKPRRRPVRCRQAYSLSARPRWWTRLGRRVVDGGRGASQLSWDSWPRH